MWQYALWGIAGAAANCGIAYLEVSTRVKGWPWRRSNGGPGGGVYLSWVMINLGVAGVTTWAIAYGDIINTNAAAFGAGVAAPALVKKLAAYSETSALTQRSGEGNG
ncbi:hypothetical protein [Nocardia amamiensis]|uniref:hypothetical protein n=1 Tax=Nocardia amamiensis TaxID=404578 RepID=UPI00082FC3FC|nr:hypothetical protein [Nocardia amamiensis]